MPKQYIFGLHSVESLLRHQPDRVIRLLFQDKHDKKIAVIIHEAKNKNIPMEQIAKQELDKLTEFGNHQGIAALCEKQRVYTENDLPNLLGHLAVPPFVLVLDGVQDPHNLGACFRTADAAGVHAIVAPKDKAVGITPVVSKVASGATETIPFVQVTNLVRALEVLKELNIWIYGADAEAKEVIYQTDLTGPVALVMGAEGTGLRRLTREHCDILVNIPMYGSVSSLNVSVATGVMMFEVLRQRNREKFGYL